MRGEFGVSGPALLLPAGPLEAQWGCFGLCTAGIGLSLRTKVAISLGKFVPVLALTAVFLLFQLNFLLLQPVCFPLALDASLGRVGLCFSLFLPVQCLQSAKMCLWPQAGQIHCSLYFFCSHIWSVTIPEPLL